MDNISATIIRKDGDRRIYQKGKAMGKVYITLTGTKYYYGNEFLRRGMKLKLEKDPKNEFDKEAIKVMYDGLGQIGSVANSTHTVIGESISAGRLYDKIGEKATARVVVVTEIGTICEVSEKSLKKVEAWRN